MGKIDRRVAPSSHNFHPGAETDGTGIRPNCPRARRGPEAPWLGQPCRTAKANAEASCRLLLRSGKAGLPPFPRAGLALPSPAVGPAPFLLLTAEPAPKSSGRGRAARSWCRGGMRSPPGRWWLLLWLPPLSTPPAGAVRGEEEEAATAALSGNRGHGRRAGARAHGLPASRALLLPRRPAGALSAPGGGEEQAACWALPRLVRLTPRARPPAAAGPASHSACLGSLVSFVAFGHFSDFSGSNRKSRV